LTDTSTPGRSLDFSTLRQANLARAKEWNPTGADTGPGFAGLELAGEVGELCNLLKKAERARLGLVGGSVSPAAIAEELADVVICADLVGLALGLDLWPIVVAKFNATSEAKGFATRLGHIGAPATAAALDLAERKIEALLELVYAYQDAADNAPVEGEHDLESLRKEESIAVRGRHAEECCLSLGIYLDNRFSATRLGDPIPVSVARFKDAGHPATAAGEALDLSKDEVLRRCRQHMLIRDDLALIEELRTLLLGRLDQCGEPALCGWIKTLVIQSFEHRADHSRLLANAAIVGLLFALARPADGAGGVS